MENLPNVPKGTLRLPDFNDGRVVAAWVAFWLASMKFAVDSSAQRHQEIPIPVPTTHSVHTRLITEAPKQVAKVPENHE